jgi:hypothetical protein
MRRGVLLLLIILSLAVSLWLILTSVPFEQCFADTGTSNWGEAIWVYRTCVGEYLRVQGAEALVIFTVVLAISTIFLWLSTHDLANQARLAAQHTRTVERAYVKLSHAPPGITPGNSTGLFWLKLGVKNYGTTPAKVTDIFIKPVVLPHEQPLPGTPDYTPDQHQSSRAFLVAQDEFFVARYYQIPAEQMAAVRDLTHELYLIGYVDYIDQFGQRHRGGYARVYRPRLDDPGQYRTDADYQNRNNLIFVTQDGYNYDRPRTRREGNDWE